jgi:nitrate/nitrite transport system permease protein
MSSKSLTASTFELPWLERTLGFLAGDGINRMADGLTRNLVLPLLGVGIFLILWAAGASRIETSLGQLPGPVQVFEQAQGLWGEHQAEREREEAFYARLDDRVAKAEADGKSPEQIAKMRERTYTGAPTFIDQIWTSIGTVATGFILASLIAVPIGVLCGMSAGFYAGMNPLIQIFKPVSPLAWLPLVTIIVSALYVSDNPMVSKSFLISAITVTLCCLWPTIINTTVGVATVDRDLMNVSRVLRLSWVKQTLKIILPSAMPMIFTGLRLSLGIGWMVLIAAEMLAQNPGLGKFVWDEFQNGSSNSLARIMVAVLVIGFTGFLLDRGMLMLQRRVSWDKNATLR